MHEPQINRRPIRSFVLREGRLTPAQERAFQELWVEYGVDWRPGDPLEPSALFADVHPIYLEIGFGNGEALAELASDHPQRNFLGIEVHRPGVGHLLLTLNKRGLENVRILRQDAVEVLEQGLPPASLAGLYLLFPDPWPKKKHHKRRILQPAFVRSAARVLRPGALLHVATDWEPYARQILEMLGAADDQFANSAGPGAFSSRSDERPLTKFEQRGRRLGHEVRDLVFRRR